jgi:anhydro-N-acetylmuramic acid kinase
MSHETGSWAIGLMSGTSLDGLDAALIRSDAERLLEAGPFLSEPYDEAFRARLRRLLGGAAREEVAPVEHELTERHAAAIERLLAEAGLPKEKVAVVGVHGQTIHHAPEKRQTWQIGEGALLARLTGLPVVNELRLADVAEGGQGAPLAPAYHRALARGIERPLAVLNLGGVGNVTWLGEGEEEILAFDTGPANALLDDWVLQHGAGRFDAEGRLAAAGRVEQHLLDQWLRVPYFEMPPPKSLDRDAFKTPGLETLMLEDGAATLTAFTAASVARAGEFFPKPVGRVLVTGGGRRNPMLMAMLAARLGVSVEPVESFGWDGDALEAQAFAFLALRALKGLPITYPGTTGAPRPLTGGRLHRP